MKVIKSWCFLSEEKEKCISNQCKRRKRAFTPQKSEKSSLLCVQGARLPTRCSVSFLQSRSLPAPQGSSCVPSQPLHSDPSTCHPHTSCLCISHFLSLGLAPTHALLCGRHTLIQISSQLSLLPLGLAVSSPLQTPQPQPAVSVFSAGKSE